MRRSRKWCGRAETIQVHDFYLRLAGEARLGLGRGRGALLQRETRVTHVQACVLCRCCSRKFLDRFSSRYAIEQHWLVRRFPFTSKRFSCQLCYFVKRSLLCIDLETVS